MNFLQISRPIDPISSETIFRIAGFPINNSTIFIIFILFLIIALCFIIRKFSINPNKTQNIIEIIYEGIESFITQITGSKRETNVLFPFIGTLFIFIVISNLLGLVPGLTSFTWNGKAILRTPTADFNTTFSLAVGAILIIQLISIKDFGFFNNNNRI